MRNVVPQLVFAGETDLGFEVLRTVLKHTMMKGRRGGKDSAEQYDSRDQCAYFIRAMIKEELDPTDQVVPILMTMKVRLRF